MKTIIHKCFFKKCKYIEKEKMLLEFSSGESDEE